MEPLKFSLVLKEVEVVLSTSEGDKKYILRELSGEVRDKYLASMADRMKYDDKGKPSGVKNFHGLQASLLSLCLINEEGKTVSVMDLQKFPASVQSALFEKANELSALNKEGQEEAKNE